MALHAVESRPKVIVAIDFGTSYSGFSYAELPLAEPEPYASTICFEQWPSQDEVRAKNYCKTQTSLLYVERDFRPQEFELKAWGWTAFHEMRRLQKQASKTFHFITNFKLTLAGSEKDGEVYKLPEGFTAQRVVSDYLQQLSILVEDELKKKYGEHIEKKDILWCLTVPAIWDNSAKEEMRRCAEIAGLVAGPLNVNGHGSPHPVIIVLESEAASAYCLHHLQSVCPTYLERQKKILVVDAGGGTVDLTFHETVNPRKDPYRVKEISRGSGDCCGSSGVDAAFFKFLARRITCFGDFQRGDSSGALKIQEIWENRLFYFDGTTGRYDISLSTQWSKYWEAYEKKHGNATADSTYYEEVKITADEMKSIFNSVVVNILELIEDQLKQVKSDELKSVTIAMVGGFSESPYLKNQIKERFEKRVERLIFPRHPGKAVVVGAAIYGGLGGDTVISRISRKTYGISYNGDWHPTDLNSNFKVQYANRRPNCKDAFHVCVRKGDPISVNHCQKMRYTASNRGLLVTDTDKDVIKLEVYSTNANDASFAANLASVKESAYIIQMPSGKATSSNEDPMMIDVSIYFGRATIEATAEALNFKGEKASLPILTLAPFEVSRSQRQHVDEMEVINSTLCAEIASERKIADYWKAEEKLENEERIVGISVDAHQLAETNYQLNQVIHQLAETNYQLNQVIHQLAETNYQLHQVRTGVMTMGKSTSAMYGQLYGQLQYLTHQMHSSDEFKINEKNSSVPRLVYPAFKQTSTKRWQINKIVDRMTRDSCKLRFLCEAYQKDGSLHEVHGQEGIDFESWKPWVQTLVPCLVWSIKIIVLSAVVVTTCAHALPFVLPAAVSTTVDTLSSVHTALTSGATFSYAGSGALTSGTTSPSVPGPILFSTYTSVSSALSNVKLSSDSTANSLKALIDSIDHEEIHSGVTSDQSECRQSRQFLRKKLKDLGGDFDKKVGLTKVALKDYRGTFNNVIWICKPCLSRYEKDDKVRVLDDGF